jgi:hypothetical protein
MLDFAEGCLLHDIDFIVIGDTKSPADFFLPGCDYISIERQRMLPYGLAAILPEKHYARKNLGYLLAMERGAEIIIETDDDNYPMQSFWSERTTSVASFKVSNTGWVNVYRYFTDLAIWPRGFPLELIKNPLPHIDSSSFGSHYCPIQQGLADENPDVDAIYRLTRELPFYFKESGPVAIGSKHWTPFNSQNTTWFKNAFLLLYIPSYCSFRMCDIWRSFVATRICWDNDWNILFHYPTVHQERNEHSLLEDFFDETIGYLNNYSICNELEKLNLKSGIGNIPDGLINCYEAFIRNGLIDKNEIKILEKWIDDVNRLIAI